MATTNTKLTPEFYQALSNRSENAIELESVNHYLTLWFCSHRGFEDEITQYNTTCDYMRLVADGDEIVETALLLTAAKDAYRMVYGHAWEMRR